MMAKKASDRPTAVEVAAILNAESIRSLPDSAGLTGFGTSSSETDWQGIQTKTRTSTSGSSTLNITNSLKWYSFLTAKVSKLWLVLLALITLLCLCSLALWLYVPKGPPRQDRRAVEKLFPNAPESYGTRKPGQAN
jgi:hypothetical protein